MPKHVLKSMIVAMTYGESRACLYTMDMARDEELLFQTNSEFQHYEVVDQIYNGRAARLLFSGNREAVQSAMPRDDNPEPVFDYNQRFLEVLQQLNPRRVLLIGGGVYTFPMAALRALPTMLLDVVELDPALDHIATAFFDFKPNERLNIFHGDGRTFLEANTQPYDAILIDAFRDLTMPTSLSTIEAVRAIHHNLKPDGLVLVNIVSAYRGRRATTIRCQDAAYRSVFPRLDIYPAGATYGVWQSQNLVLMAQNMARSINFRYQALPSLNTTQQEALRD